MEECLTIIKKECVLPSVPPWGPIKIPPILTKDNINHFVNFPANSNTLLECIVFYTKNWKNTEKALLFLLGLGATVSRKAFTHSLWTIRFFLEQGIHPNSFETDQYLLWHVLSHISESQRYKQACLLIDYGINQERLYLGESDVKFYDYYRLSNTRVSICRKSLCALLWCSRRGFIPLRGIILELARFVWAQRGGEGCGARGYEWKKE